jgi:proteic killer suppression protein
LDFDSITWEKDKSLRFKFEKKWLSELYEGSKRNPKFSKQVIIAFERVMATIVAANDERDLYELRHLRFEKLKGDRSKDRSMRLTDQFRLIVRIHEDEQEKYFLICNIEDYH